MAGLLGRLARTLNPKTGAAGELIAGEAQPVFYSALEDAIRTNQTKVAPGSQWLATLKRAPGVKAQEIEWSGIEKFLGNLADEPVRRQELDDFMYGPGTEKYRIGEELMSQPKTRELSKEQWEREFLPRVKIRQDRHARENYNGNYRPMFAESFPVDQPAEYGPQRWRGVIQNGDDEIIETLDGLFSGNTEAWRAARDRRDYLDDRGREGFVQRARETGDYYDDAYEEILSENPLNKTIRHGRTYYDTYSVPGGENYDELVLTLPEEFASVEGKPSTHWEDKLGGADQAPDFAHIRYKDRFAPEFEPGAQEAYEQGLDSYRASLDGITVEKRKLNAQHREASNMLLAEMDSIDRDRAAEGLPPVGTLSSDEINAIYNDNPVIRDTRDIRIQIKERLDELELNQPRAPSAPEPISERRVLAIDEAQSDWHQAGRKKGYAESPEAVRKLEAAHHNASDAYHAARRGAVSEVADIPQIHHYLATRMTDWIGRGIKPSDIPYILRGEALPIGHIPHHSTNRLLEIAEQQIEPALGDATRELNALVDRTGPHSPNSMGHQLAERVTALNNRVADADRAMGDAYEAFDKARNGVAKPPFANNTWATIALKRMLRKAADEGYDEVAWSGNIKNGNWRDGGQEGGEFYDKILVNEANTLGKKFGVQVEKGNVPIRDNQDAMWNTLKITPEFREFIKKGWPLFMWPLFAGGAASTGLLGRGSKREEA